MSNSHVHFPSEYLGSLPSLGVIQLTGPERKAFLQGQVTNDVNKLNKHQAQFNCHCDFKGKTWNNFQLLEYQDNLLLVGDKGAHSSSMEQLKKYAVFSKVDIQDTTQDWAVLGGYGESLEQLIEQLFGDTPFENGQIFQNDTGLVVCFTSPRPRYLLLLKSSEASKFLNTLSRETESDALWQLMNIQAGVAQITAETSNEYVPQMLNMHLLEAISFEKGCYMGQEVVARTKYLGKNKRSCFILKADSNIQLNNADVLESQVGDNWRRGGTVINHVSFQDQTWLLAVLASDTPSAATMRLKAAPTQHFTVQPSPYLLED